MLNWIKTLFRVKQKNTGNPFLLTAEQADKVCGRIADSFTQKPQSQETREVEKPQQL